MCLNVITWSMFLSDLWNHVLEHVERKFRLKKGRTLLQNTRNLIAKMSIAKNGALLSLQT